MRRISRPKRHSRHLPETPPDSNLSRSPFAASEKISGDEYISQPPRTYRPSGRRPERRRDSQSRQYEDHSSRNKPRKNHKTSYRWGGTYWDDSMSRPVLFEHRKRQSERVSGNGDRIFVTVGIDTERHFRRASLTLPQPPGKSYFSSSRKPRISQDSSRRKTSRYHSKPHVPRTNGTDTHIRTDHLNGAGGDPKERTWEGTKKGSKRDQENCVRPELTVENVTLNARRASPSSRPDVRDEPTHPPCTAEANTRPERGSRSKPKSRDLPSNGVPNPETGDGRDGSDRPSRRGETYPSRDGHERVSCGRIMERKERRKVPVTAGDDQKDTATYRSWSPQLASYSVDRQSKPTRPTRQSGNGHRQTPKELGLDSSPSTSDVSGHTDYSVYQRRRTVRRKQTQQTTCSCTVS
jgi:hypothetical protein